MKLTKEQKDKNEIYLERLTSGVEEILQIFRDHPVNGVLFTVSFSDENKQDSMLFDLSGDFLKLLTAVKYGVEDTLNKLDESSGKPLH